MSPFTARRRRNPVRGKVAVVTGAASGIGRALALELARRGARLSLADLDERGLERTATAVGGRPHRQVLDVADADGVDAFAAEVAARHGVVHQVYNNAGIAFAGSVLDSGRASYERVLAVNLGGVINGTRAFLPHLVASGDGHVVNISSLNGIAAQEGLSHYCASKYAVRGFTEAVRADMLHGRHPVAVTVVHPGGVRTQIADHAVTVAAGLGVTATPESEARRRTYNERLLRMPAEVAARTIVDGVELGRARILVGRDAKAVDALVRLAPAAYVPLLASLTRRATG